MAIEPFTGNSLVLTAFFPGAFQAGPGYKTREDILFFRSQDAGLTWTGPENLTVDILFTDAEGNYAMRRGIPRFHHIHGLAYDLPLAGIYEPGQMIKEEYGLVVPSSIAPGQYYISVGVCKEKSFLKVNDEKAMGNFIAVGTICVL